MDYNDFDMGGFEEEWPAEPEQPIEPSEPEPELPIEPSQPQPELPIEPNPPQPELPVEPNPPQPELPIEPSPIPPEPPAVIVIPPPIWWLNEPWDYWYPRNYSPTLYQRATLAVTSVETVRIRVVDADKRTLFDAEMAANQSQRWQGQAPFAISVADVAAISIYYQDVKVDLSEYPQGQTSYFQVPPNR